MPLPAKTFWIALLTAGLMWLAGPGRATQIALVDRDVGHALLFQHRGNCYALLPAHVAERDTFSLQMPLQNLIGIGTVFLRDDDSDLALAFVEGDIVQRCTDAWSGFQTDLSTLLDNRKDGEILRLSPEGVLDRTAARIYAVTPEIVAVRTSNALALGEIQKGSSGSVLEVGGTVIGIAQTAPSASQAVFFRMDEIARRLGRELSLQSLGRDATQQGGFRVTGWSGKQDTSQADEAGGGLLTRALVTQWDGKPQQIEITLDPDKPVALYRLRLGSAPAHPDQSPPKTVMFEVDAGVPGAPFWRSLGARDMTPRGELLLETGGVFVRRVRITLASVWFADRPLVRLDRLEIE